MNYKPPLGAIVLKPYDPREAISPDIAARQTHRTTETMRQWASLYALGRKVGGRWFLSRVALAMFLENDFTALKAFHLGDRASELVEPYLKRLALSV